MRLSLHLPASHHATVAGAFLVAFASACSSRPSQPPCHADAGGSAFAVHRTFDINCDGHADAVLFSYPSAQVFLGGPSGLATTASQTITAPTENASGILAAPLGDVNGDGYADLVIIRRLATGTDLLHYFGRPGGLSEMPVLVHTTEVAGELGLGSERMEIADFNRDGLLDLAMLTSRSSGRSTGKVFLGSPDGLHGDAWSTIEVTNGGEHGPVWSIVGSGDFDGDGYADLLLEAVADSSSHLTVFRGTPSGLVESVSAPIVSLLFGALTARLAWVPGDVNGDHYSDAIAIGRTNGSFDVFFGGARGLATSPSLTVTPAPGEGFADLLAWGDMNGDGIDDAFAASVATSATGVARRVVLLTGSVNGPALAPYWSNTDPNADVHGIETRDFDGDGFADTVLGWRTVESGSINLDHAIVVRGGSVAPSTPDGPFIVSGELWE